MKKSALMRLCSLLLFTVILNSCQKTGATVYSDHISAHELAEEAEDSLPGTDFRSADSNWLSDYVTLPDNVTDFEIRFSSDGNNLNEFGIWHVKTDQIAPMEASLRTYLAESLLRNRSFYDSYIPEETPKLSEAEIRVFGNYVCYAILNASDRALFFKTIEDELRED